MLVAAAAACLLAAASAAYTSDCPDGPYKVGEMCAGAPGKPAVPWCGCVSPASCTGEPAYGGYGKVCAEADKGVCHAPGDRCMGAQGKPYVEYGKGCCEEGSECVDKDEEYGMKCSTPYSGNGGKVYGGKKCWGVGERCMGAAGKPYVEYGEGCCEEGSECVVKDEVYGMKCSEPKGGYGYPNNAGGDDAVDASGGGEDKDETDGGDDDDDATPTETSL